MTYSIFNVVDGHTYLIVNGMYFKFNENSNYLNEQLSIITVNTEYSNSYINGDRIIEIYTEVSHNMLIVFMDDRILEEQFLIETKFYNLV